MLPFPIMNTYGNIVVAPDVTIKKILTPTTSTTHMGILVLYSNGDLYGIGGGTAINYMFGTGSTTTNYTSWQKIRSNVKDVWSNTVSQVLVQGNDNTFFYVGTKFDGTSGNVTTYTDCTAFISGIGSGNIQNIKEIQLGAGQIYVLLNNGSLWRAGDGSYGSLGTGSASNLTAMTLLQGYTVQKMICCIGHLWIITTDGLAYRCGNNGYGQLGTGNTTTLNSLTQYSSSIYDVVDICGNFYASFLVFRNKSTSALSLWAAGQQTTGNLGNNVSSTGNVSSFAQITFTLGSTWNFKVCYTGYVGIPIYTNGNLYFCGVGTSGRTGLGSTANRLTLQSTVSSGDIKFFSTSTNSSVYMLSDGILHYAGCTVTGSNGSGSWSTLALPI